MEDFFRDESDEMMEDDFTDGPYLPDDDDWMEPGEELVINNNGDDVTTGPLGVLSSISPEEECDGERNNQPMQNIQEDSSDRPTTGWSELPHIVLSEVFRYLNDADRISAARVCKRWKVTLEDPSLWRWRHWRFGSTCVSGNYSEAVLEYARKYGQHMHKLSIKCPHPTYSVAKKFQRSLSSALHALNSRGSDNRQCELRELKLNELHIERYWRHESIRERLISTVCRFLRRQHRLKFCDFTENSVNAQDGFKIIDALGEGSGRQVQVLNIEDFFASRLAIYAVPRFRLVMSSFHNLHSLMLNYNYLSEDLVDQLAANCARNHMDKVLLQPFVDLVNNRLKCFTVKVYRLDPCRHTVHPHSWFTLRKACPALRVCLYFEAMGAYSDLTRIACQEIPLKVVQIWTGMNYQDEYWRLSDTIRYLGKTFYKYLEEACFYLENPREEIDDALLNFLSKTQYLEKLELQGVIQIRTLATICEWQEKYKIGLQRFHVSADNLNALEVDALDAVVDKYREMLDERGHDFQLLANPGF